MYKGLSSVYVFTNDVSLSGLVRAAQKAADAIGSADRTVDVRLTGAIPRNIHAIAQLPMDVPGERRARVVKAADAAARAVSAEVSQVTARLYDWETDVVIANSEGLLVPDRRVYTRLALTAVASAGGESQTGSYNPGAMMGFELFDGRVDPEEVGPPRRETGRDHAARRALPGGGDVRGHRQGLWRRHLPRGLRALAGSNGGGLRQFRVCRQAGAADRFPPSSPPSTTAPWKMNGAPST